MGRGGTRYTVGIVLRLASVGLVCVLAGNTMLLSFYADPESNLPACCRRAGKHHCVMMQAVENDVSCSLRATQQRCQQFPTTCPSLDAGATTVSVRFNIRGPVPNRFVPNTQPEALLHISHCRSRQKRGPPSLS